MDTYMLDEVCRAVSMKSTHCIVWPLAQDKLLCRPLDSGCIFIQAAWNVPPMQLLCHPNHPTCLSTLLPSHSTGLSSQGQAEEATRVLSGMGWGVKMGICSAQRRQEQGWEEPSATKGLEVKSPMLKVHEIPSLSQETLSHVFPLDAIN